MTESLTLKTALKRMSAILGLSLALAYTANKIVSSKSDGPRPLMSRMEKASWEQKKHLLSVDKLSREQVEVLIKTAQWMEIQLESRNILDLCKGKVLANIFYEPSTRTCCSFQAAMIRLGGQNINITNTSTSSVAKGETLEDTIKCLASYADAISLRHGEVGAPHRAAHSADIPIINAGDGSGEHPTQALLDIYTMLSEQGQVDGKTITIAGDLKHGRTVHSLAKLLTRFNVTLQFASPPSLGMPEDVLNACKKAKVNYTIFTDLGLAIKSSDILYMTRVQKERFKDPAEYNKVKDKFVLNKDFLEKSNAQTGLTIMHPLPRVNEIDSDVDDLPGAAYFRQMRYGMIMRMAILWLLIKEN